jgi:hypothetical protein
MREGVTISATHHPIGVLMTPRLLRCTKVFTLGTELCCGARMLPCLDSPTGKHYRCWLEHHPARVGQAHLQIAQQIRLRNVVIEGGMQWKRLWHSAV